MSVSSQKELATLLASEIVRELDRPDEGGGHMIAGDVAPLPPYRRPPMSKGGTEGSGPRSLDFLMDIARRCKEEPKKKKAKKKGGSGEAPMGTRAVGRAQGDGTGTARCAG